MSEELKNKIHELDVLSEELSTLRPNAAVYAKRVPSSRLLFRESKVVLTDHKKKELSEAKADLVAIPNQAAA